jgi:hypothetical protein
MVSQNFRYSTNFMTDRRYQVFVSSTFIDLKEEREAVIRALLEMNCIPAGMELFPAIDEEQFEFIKRVIDDCDYYVIILAARYGSSISPDGISYIEKEYDYAVSRKIPVLAFLHRFPGSIAADKVELGPDARERLSRFRDKLKTGRLVREWETSKDLRAEVALSLPQTIKVHPAPGWIRGNIAASTELLSEVNTLRQENTQLIKEIEQLRSEPMFSDLARGQDIFEFSCSADGGIFRIQLSWDDIFALLGPKILNRRRSGAIRDDLGRALNNTGAVTDNMGRVLKRFTSFWILQEDFETIGIQFSALKLLSISSERIQDGRDEQLWQVTEAGRRYLHEVKAIRKQI